MNDDGRPRPALIRPHAHVVLRDMEGLQKVFAMDPNGKDLHMGRYPAIPVATLLKVPYGSYLRWGDGLWSRSKAVSASTEVKVEDEDGDGEEAATDNRHLAQDNSAQALRPDDISELKKRCSGDEVVAAIASHSTTFAGKTKFSQEKYIKKKMQKHV